MYGIKVGDLWLMSMEEVTTVENQRVKLFSSKEEAEAFKNSIPHWVNNSNIVVEEYIDTEAN